jgi:hypothetical protein
MRKNFNLKMRKWWTCPISLREVTKKRSLKVAVTIKKLKLPSTRTLSRIFSAIALAKAANSEWINKSNQLLPEFLNQKMLRTAHAEKHGQRHQPYPN